MKASYYYTKYERNAGRVAVHRWYKVLEFGSAVYAEMRISFNDKRNYKIGTISSITKNRSLPWERVKPGLIKITKRKWLRVFGKCFDNCKTDGPFPYDLKSEI